MWLYSVLLQCIQINKTWQRTHWQLLHPRNHRYINLKMTQRCYLDIVLWFSGVVLAWTWGCDHVVCWVDARLATSHRREWSIAIWNIHESNKISFCNKQKIHYTRTWAIKTKKYCYVVCHIMCHLPVTPKHKLIKYRYIYIYIICLYT